MTKLSDTQATLLAAAARRPEGDLLPLPDTLRGGAAAKVVGALLSRGLIREEPTDASAEADAAPDERAVVLRITKAGREAIGAMGEASSTARGPAPAQRPGDTLAGPQTAEVPAGRRPSRPPRARRAAPAGADAVARPRTRGDSQQALLIALLKRPEGATIAGMTEATGWQAHTIRGALAGPLKKRLGFAVTSEKVEGARVYLIEG